MNYYVNAGSDFTGRFGKLILDKIYLVILDFFNSQLCMMARAVSSILFHPTLKRALRCVYLCMYLFRMAARSYHSISCDLSQLSQVIFIIP